MVITAEIRVGICLKSREWWPGMLLNFLQRIGKSPTQRLIQPKMSTVEKLCRLRNPTLTLKIKNKRGRVLEVDRS